MLGRREICIATLVEWQCVEVRGCGIEPCGGVERATALDYLPT